MVKAMIDIQESFKSCLTVSMSHFASSSLAAVVSQTIISDIQDLTL